MQRIAFAGIIILLILSSCQYRDFLPYYRSVDKETHLPQFSDWTRFMGENHGLRSCYDVHCYDWRIHVNQSTQFLYGTMTIKFEAMEAQDSLLLDLGSALKVTDISGTLPIKSFHRKRNALFVVLEAPMTAGSLEELIIEYKGKPVSILNQGPVMWEEDEQGNPFVGTITQGIGPHHMMPCKDLLVDEPDSCFIRVSSRTDQVVAANGELLEVEPSTEGDIYHFRVHNPINIYNLSFNIGSFISGYLPYRDINGVERQIEIVALDSSLDEAMAHYAQTQNILESLERRWGTFPWWEDGCKIVQSTYSAMEHQSAISMGRRFDNGYQGIDMTLVHELSHEWWGNMVTASDYADAWLHEGFATYNEALYVEEKLGQDAFYQILEYQQRGIANERPVRKEYGVRYNSWANYRDTDIYDKGCMILHTIRKQLDNDSLYFETLRMALSSYDRSTWSSEEFIQHLTISTSTNWEPLLNYYLDEPLPPTLVFRSVDEDGTKEYKWQTEMPEGFRFRVDAMIGKESLTFYPSNEWQQIVVPEGASLTMNTLDSGYFLVE